MSSATPTERATAAHRLEFAMKDLELSIILAGSPTAEHALSDLRKRVDDAIEVLTRV